MQSTNEKKWTKVKKSFEHLGLTAQSHGIPKIFNSERKLFKIMWLIFTVGSAGFCIFGLIRTVNDYFKYPVVTNINVITEIPTEFPAVKICSLMPTLKNYSLQDRIIKCEFK